MLAEREAIDRRPPRSNGTKRMASACGHGVVRPLAWPAAGVRRAFVDYFKLRDHVHVAACSVLPPTEDKSLLFTSAGMNQFKSIFLGQVRTGDRFDGLKRAVNSQKCIRYNDLHLVGTTHRHQTFFEMLGMWSFNDYFKMEACQMAWDLLINLYKLDRNRLFVTYFGGDRKLGLDADNETLDIWLKIGVERERIIALGSDDNFWQMGPTGPCGICTEIHYLLKPVQSFDDRLELERNSIEIWNIVFIQFDRQPNGELKKLEQRHVDTGMGLERVTSVLQDVQSNYATDLFVPLLSTIQKVTGVKPFSDSLTDEVDIAYRILADHSRMYTVSIADGLRPNAIKGKAPFCLRKCISRSMFTAKKVLKVDRTNDLLKQLASAVSVSLGDVYPEVGDNIGTVHQILDKEVDRFERLIGKTTAYIKRKLPVYSSDVMDIDDVLDLHLNHSVPQEVIQQVTETFNLQVDWSEFETKNYEIRKSRGEFSERANLRYSETTV